LRRVCVVSAVLLASTLQVRSQSQPPQPPPFRAGTTLVQVDAIVADPAGAPVVDLQAADFDVFDDGRPVAIQSVRFLGASQYSGDATLAPIRTHDDEEREASRDDVRLYAILLDDYHVQRMHALRVIEPLLSFVESLPPTDLVGVYYPLDSVVDVNFQRDRAPALKAIRAFYGRRGDYTPKRPVEEEHLRRLKDIETIRAQITTGALSGLAAHLGGLKQGRKALIFVSEGFVQRVDDVNDVLFDASRANVAIYPLDPRGLANLPEEQLTANQVMDMKMPGLDFLRVLASQTGGRAIVQRNDLRGGLNGVLRDSSAYYLIAYESPHAADGKFHKITVRVKRQRTTVFSRTGYWALKPSAQLTSTPAAAPPEAVRAAIDKLADSLRPDAGESLERRRLGAAPISIAAQTAPIGTPIVATMRGKTVGPPAQRREFTRADTLRIRAPLAGTVSVTGQLLGRNGQRLTDLPVNVVEGACEVTLPLPNLGPGDYVVQLSAGEGGEAARQYVAFRILR
jgi:VWFA-related protein